MVHCRNTGASHRPSHVPVRVRVTSLGDDMGSDEQYYRKRLDEETRRAEAETDSSVRQVHETLAKMYHARLLADEPRIPPL